MGFYENFERLCRQRGISPSKAVLALGRDKSAASSWKSKGTLPKQDELIALADMLDCDVSDFFVFKPNFATMRDAEAWEEEHRERVLSRYLDENQLELCDIYDHIEGNRSKRRFMFEVEEIAEERYGIVFDED